MGYELLRKKYSENCHDTYSYSCILKLQCNFRIMEYDAKIFVLYILLSSINPHELFFD